MTDLEGRDHTDDLAETLGLPAARFARVFGAGWQPAPGEAPHDFDSDPSGGSGADVTPWYVAGHPPQLMARVFGHGLFLAIPEGSWAAGTHDLVYWPAHQAYVPAPEVETPAVEQLVRGLLRRRRSGFRYCRYCRRVTPSELRVGDSCMGCAGAWEGIVY